MRKTASLASSTTLLPLAYNVNSPQLADLLNLKNPAATRRAAARGLLPVKRFGKRLIVLRSDLEPWLSTLPSHAQTLKQNASANRTRTLRARAARKASHQSRAS